MTRAYEHQRKLTPEQDRRLRNDVALGMSNKDAMAKYGVSSRTVERRRAGVGTSKKLDECGTIGAYRRHLKNKERACLRCMDANRLYEADRVRKKNKA